MNGLTSEAAVRLAAFAAMLAAMAAWEAWAPRRRLRVGRRRWPANLALASLDALALRLVAPLGVYGVAERAAARGWGLLNAVDAPAWLEFGLAIVLLDLTIYLQHRVFHAVPLLWRFHKVHHADNDFDVTTGLRFHTASMLLSLGVKMAATVGLGANPLAVLASETALNLTAMFNHGNVRVPARLDRVLRWLVVTPDMHRVHHSVEASELGRNFGFNFPWWDRLLGTYRSQPAAGHAAMTIGLAEHQTRARQGLAWMLALPFQTRAVPSARSTAP